MMASALLRLPCSDKVGHALEDFVSSSQLFDHEMTTVQLEEPMVKFALLGSPVSFL